MRGGAQAGDQACSRPQDAREQAARQADRAAGEVAGVSLPPGRRGRGGRRRGPIVRLFVVSTLGIWKILTVLLSWRRATQRGRSRRGGQDRKSTRLNSSH